jgi:acetyl esterase/lipase
MFQLASVTQCREDALGPMADVVLEFAGCQCGWDVEGRFDVVAAVSSAPKLPILLTRISHKYPDFASTQDAFVDAARGNGVALHVIEVPGGQHGFDSLDHTEESRAAMAQANDLGRGSTPRQVSLEADGKPDRCGRNGYALGAAISQHGLLT